MNIETKDKSLATADLAAAAQAPAPRREVAREPSEAELVETGKPPVRAEEEQLAALFLPDAAEDFRAQWDAVQISFVDDPKQAVRKADELVAQVMKSLAQSFSNERTKLEGELDQTDKASTENLRVALRRYRSFFQRLLSL
jgi:hypothetical protein